MRRVGARSRQPDRRAHRLQRRARPSGRDPVRRLARRRRCRRRDRARRRSGFGAAPTVRRRRRRALRSRAGRATRRRSPPSSTCSAGRPSGSTGTVRLRSARPAPGSRRRRRSRWRSRSRSARSPSSSSSRSSSPSRASAPSCAPSACPAGSSTRPRRVLGREGEAILLDCGTLEHRARARCRPTPRSSIVDSAVSHSHETRATPSGAASSSTRCSSSARPLDEVDGRPRRARRCRSGAAPCRHRERRVRRLRRGARGRRPRRRRRAAAREPREPARRLRGLDPRDRPARRARARRQAPTARGSLGGGFGGSILALVDARSRRASSRRRCRLPTGSEPAATARGSSEPVGRRRGGARVSQRGASSRSDVAERVARLEQPVALAPCRGRSSRCRARAGRGRG